MTAPKKPTSRVQVIPLLPQRPLSQEPVLFQDKLPSLDHTLLSRQPTGWWRSYIEILGATGVSLDFFVWASLLAVATVAQESALVRGHTDSLMVDLNLWLLGLAPPGSGKSVAFKRAFSGPLSRAATDLNEEVRHVRRQTMKAIARLAREEKALRGHLDKLDLAETLGDTTDKADSAKRLKIEARLLELDQQVAELFAGNPRIKLDMQSDTTAEAMVRHVHDVDRFALVSEEVGDTLSGLFGHQDQKRAGCLLNMYDGQTATEQLRVRDQRSAAERGDAALPRARAYSEVRATFGGFSQPTTASSFGAYAGRGLTARTLFLCRLEHARRNSEPNDVEIDGPERQRYTDALEALCQLPGLRDHAKPVIFLSDRAMAAFRDFYDWVEDERSPGGSLSTSSGLGEWAARLAQQVLRIAGLFCLTDQLDSSDQVRLEGVKVAGDQMDRAIKLVRTLIPHAVYFFGGLAESPEASAARHLLSRLRSARGGEAFKPGDLINRRDVGRRIHASEDDHFAGKVGPKPMFQCAWDELVSRGILAVADDKATTFRLSDHPAVKTYWFEAQQTQAVTPGPSSVTPKTPGVPWVSHGPRAGMVGQLSANSTANSQELANGHAEVSREFASEGAEGRSGGAP